MPVAMSCVVKPLMLLLGVQLVAVENSWIVQDAAGRRYLMNFNAYSSRRVVPYAVRTWKEKGNHPSFGRTRTTTAAKSHVGETRAISAENGVANNSCPVADIFPLDSGIPCNTRRNQTPMFVYFSFDDAVTSWNIRFYRLLFAGGRRNPNGCRIGATFFSSHGSTEYGLLMELYEGGHEMASHSVSHRGPSTWWSERATKRDWYREIVGQKYNIHRRTAAADGRRGVPLAEIRGMRAPFLAVGGDEQFDVLDENGFAYDSSMASRNARPSWPFTLHDPDAVNGRICRSRRCPRRPHRVWEVVMNVYYLNESGSVTPCSMVDGCRPRDGRQGALRFLRANFERHYRDVDKVPFGINMHAAWFAFDGYLEAMNDFIDEILAYHDVYIVPIYKLIEWIKQPATLSELNRSKFGC